MDVGKRDSFIEEDESEWEEEEVVDFPLQDGKLDPDEFRCWSCLENLRQVGLPAFQAYEHPLFQFVVCAPCNERTTVIESAALDALDLTTPAPIVACSWCGLSLTEVEVGLVPCDNDCCQRAFCTCCLTISLGGDTTAHDHVMQKIIGVDAHWECPGCKPTEFLKELVKKAHGITTVDSQLTPVDTPEDQTLDEEALQGLLDELHVVRQVSQEVDERLSDGLDVGEKRKLLDRLCRLEDLQARLHDDIDARDPTLLVGYYAYLREVNRDDGSKDPEPEYKRSADAELSEYQVNFCAVWITSFLFYPSLFRQT